MVQHKDVVLALLGASAGLAGLALVFLGLVVANLQSFAGGTRNAILDRYGRPAVAVLFASALGLVVVAMSVSWLVLLHDNHALYVSVVGLFFLELASLVIAT